METEYLLRESEREAQLLQTSRTLQIEAGNEAVSLQFLHFAQFARNNQAVIVVN